MTQADLETLHEALARAIDSVGPAQSELFLAKLALALAMDLDDPQAALAVIEDCKTGFDT